MGVEADVVCGAPFAERISATLAELRGEPDAAAAIGNVAAIAGKAYP